MQGITPPEHGVQCIPKSKHSNSCWLLLPPEGFVVNLGRKPLNSIINTNPFDRKINFTLRLTLEITVAENTDDT